jgi:hypothetical protein
MFKTYLQLRKRWSVVSIAASQRPHIEGRWLPLTERLASVGNLWCKLLQTIMDLEGGIDTFQINLV